MFSKLVVALDGSSCAENAFELALRLARLEGSKLEICSVADPSPVYGTSGPPAFIQRALEEIYAAAERIVNEALEKAKATEISAEGRVLQGEPVYEILALAKSVGADAIVIGTHGRSGLRRLFMGSVAEGVMRQSSMPVITVREQAHAPHLQIEAAS
jgi:universal stress protein A